MIEAVLLEIIYLLLFVIIVKTIIVFALIILVIILSKQTIITTCKTRGLFLAQKAFLLAFLGLSPTEWVANRISFSDYHLSGPNSFLFFFLFPFVLFQTDSHILLYLFDLSLYLLIIVFLCILLLLFYFCLLCPHNSLYTKNVYFHICTLIKYHQTTFSFQISHYT